jgi:hypothetical protein
MTQHPGLSLDLVRKCLPVTHPQRILAGDFVHHGVPKGTSDFRARDLLAAGLRCSAGIDLLVRAMPGCPAVALGGVSRALVLA